MTKFFVAIFTNLLLVLVVGCVGNITSVLDDTTCQAPCWRGIHTGATKEEVLNYLNKMPDIENGSITLAGPRGDIYDELVSWKFKDDQGYGDVALIAGKVIDISFTPSPELPASKMISLYGEPETLILQKMNLDGVYMTLRLYYPEKGICLDMRPSYNPFIDPLKTYKITPSVRVKAVDYTDPTIADWETKHGCLFGMDMKDYQKQLQKWTGYGNYKVYDLDGN